MSTPRFGRPFLARFPLEPGGVYLNHGTVGVTPKAVMQARVALLDEIERHPARFMLRELAHLRASTSALPADPGAPSRLRAAASRVGAFLGCAGDALAFVDNASSGVNAVLRSLALAPGDEIVVTDHAYGGVARAVAFLAAERGAVVKTVAWPVPIADPGHCVASLERALGPRTRLAVLDHVTSETALLLPVAALAAACRSHGVAVLVDGAHAPGAIDVRIEELGVDWYSANLHKWAFAPRGCGVLWAAQDRREGLHPAVISWGITNADWLQEFDWTGTRDPTPWLCAPAAIDFLEQELGAEAMRAHNHALAWNGAVRLADRWQRPWQTPESMIGCMAAVPLPRRFDGADAQGVRDALWFDHGIEIAVLARDGALWARVSAQVYNDDEDLERLAHAVDELARR
ncbi:MAG: aminotransferase class V-fold PLP-dependent enzyme [Caldimonas sp.]